MPAILFQNIFELLQKELQKYNTPIVTREKAGVKETPFTTLISCILSLRTKNEVTEEAAISLLSQYDTPEKIAQLTEATLANLIYPVGFYKTKAKRIKEMTQVIIKKYDGNVPDTMEELLTLKGVGRKTANIVMVYGHHRHGFLPIDTHCHRIPNRLGWIRTKTPEETEQALLKLLPEQFWDDFNDLFVLFGQKICVPISPFCSKCPIQQYCKQIGVTTKR
ncbi:MAG: endonuclease III [Candidatus Thermoplasmatota archaeon]|nr:endonuclease III [Candidatus Thermoplasmatota archaeon]MBU1941205.1 endonuclease III [Candidatus Thermoplasmatota archaeon]